MVLNFNILGLEPVGWVDIDVTSTNMVGGKEVDFPPTYSSLRTAPLNHLSLNSGEAVHHDNKSDSECMRRWQAVGNGEIITFFREMN